MREPTEYEKKVAANQQLLLSMYTKKELAYLLAIVELAKEEQQ